MPVASALLSLGALLPLPSGLFSTWQPEEIPLKPKSDRVTHLLKTEWHASTSGHLPSSSLCLQFSASRNLQSLLPHPLLDEPSLTIFYRAEPSRLPSTQNSSLTCLIFHHSRTLFVSLECYHILAFKLHKKRNCLSQLNSQHLEQCLAGGKYLFNE